MVWGVPQAVDDCEVDAGGDPIWREDNESQCLLAWTSVYVGADTANVADVRLQTWPAACESP